MNGLNILRTDTEQLNMSDGNMRPLLLCCDVVFFEFWLKFLYPALSLPMCVCKYVHLYAFVFMFINGKNHETKALCIRFALKMFLDPESDVIISDTKFSLQL